MRSRQASTTSVKRIMDTIPATQSSAPATGEVAESPSRALTPAPVVANPVSVPASDASLAKSEPVAVDSEPSAGTNFGGVNILPPPAQAEPVEDAYSKEHVPLSDIGASASDIGGDEPPKDTAENLPYFQSHKIVQAGKIESITTSDDGSIVTLENGTELQLDADWTKNRFRSKTPDSDPDKGYYVRYENEYESWSPTTAFEQGYTPVDQIPDGKNQPLSFGLQAQGQGYGPSTDGGKNLRSDENEVKPGRFRALVSALVACINTHCNSAGKDVADTKIAQFKAATAGELTNAHEDDRLNKVFKHLQEQPAPTNPIADLPEPPAYVPPSKDEQAIIAE